jgi:putative pyruvate formate lyase activating enzyme
VAVASLAACVGCARQCRADRLAPNPSSFCCTGRYAQVSGCSPHLGEENCLRGWNGSGTIFFTHCNLGCVFCQNYDISHQGQGRETTPRELAAMMLSLQKQGCHNINFVTPSHVVPQILEALVVAAQAGLRLPLVYNTGGYDSLDTLRLLDGVVDIYMPDFKFWSPAIAEEFTGAADYPEIAQAALQEMHRQVGDLEIDEQGIAQRGVLVRHLVMPNDQAGTRAIMEFLATDISPDTYVNVMAQYRPAGTARRHPNIARSTSLDEHHEALKIAREAGIHRLDAR